MKTSVFGLFSRKRWFSCPKLGLCIRAQDPKHMNPQHKNPQHMPSLHPVGNVKDHPQRRQSAKVFLPSSELGLPQSFTRRPEPVLLNVYGAPELMPRNKFRKPVRKPYSSSVTSPHRFLKIPAQCAPPTFSSGRRGTLAGDRGAGRVSILTMGHSVHFWCSLYVFYGSTFLQFRV